MKFLFIVVLLFTHNLQAQESRANIDSKEPSLSIDNEITDKKLRADSGSVSKYSMSFSAIYLGGSFKKPLSSERPNLANNPIAPATMLISTINARYRLNHRSSLSFGAGVSVVKPFAEARSEAYDPVLGYTWSGKVSGLQFWNFSTLTYYTSEFMQEAEYVVNLTHTSSIVKRVGSVNYGLSSSVWVNTFNGDTTPSLQTHYGFALTPSLDYFLSDNLSLRTVFNHLQYIHTRDKTAWNDWYRLNGSQSFGLGWSVSRDVYLYPNVQFSTEELSAEFFRERFAKESTVGVSASINVF